MSSRWILAFALPLALLAQRPPATKNNSSPPPARAVAKDVTWKIAYLYDEDQSTLSIHDIRTASPQCSIALGVLTNKGKPRGVALISKDDGVTWTQVQLKEFPRSVFMLTERLGFLATEGGVWRTGDCGATWEKAGKEKGLSAVYFLDENHGYAAGAPKKALETSDGGRTWKKLAAVDEIKSDPERSSFRWIDFANPMIGAIIGSHEPRRSDTGPPAWMDPEEARFKRQFPSLTLMLQTLDGGKTWRPSESSIFGRITRLRTVANGRGIALIEYDRVFQYPSEVYFIDLNKSQTGTVFRDPNRAITDVGLTPKGLAYIAGYETPGGEIRLPIPGKLKVLRSVDLAHWEEIPVDYRATTNHAVLATGNPGPLLIGTDTGMILRLVPNQ